jgi:predicted anti-sigma-YlaC factor YlaD
MMNCQQTTRLLSDALERELSIKERTSLKVHTMMCSGCRNFGKQMGTLRGLTHEFVKGINSSEKSASSDDLN